MVPMFERKAKYEGIDKFMLVVSLASRSLNSLNASSQTFVWPHEEKMWLANLITNHSLSESEQFSNGIVSRRHTSLITRVEKGLDCTSFAISVLVPVLLLAMQ